jgi:hypothetical protein
MNIETLLDSPAFWIGILAFFVVLGKVVETVSTSESNSKNKKGK